MLTSLLPLDGKRFIYATSAATLKVASYPRMTGTALMAAAPSAVDRASPNGLFAVYHQSMNMTTGLTDLYMVSTSSATPQAPVTVESTSTGYPGDDSFSADNAWFQYYANVDQYFIGDIKSVPTAGGASVMIGPRAYYVKNYSDVTSVMMMVNASLLTQGGQQFVGLANMAVSKRDGSNPLNILVPSVDPNTFVIFPISKNKIVYSIPQDRAHLGLWVRELPPG
jgi:hypothetical protein